MVLDREMTAHPTTLARLRNYDWKRAQFHGLDMAMDQARAGQEVTDREIWWALFEEAVKVSAICYSPAPRSGLPSKSAMPDSPDEVTQWQQVMAYIRGQIDEMPTDEARPPQPSAEQITRADMVLTVWHIAALRDMGDWKRMRKAIYLRAAGVPPRKITAITGLTRQRMHDAKNRAMADMLEFVRGMDKRTK